MAQNQILEAGKAAVGKVVNGTKLIRKIIGISLLVLMLLIPLYKIQSLVDEREDTKIATSYEISEKWGQEQSIIGPFIQVPYTHTNTTQEFQNGIAYTKNQEETRYAIFLPNNLEIETQTEASTRSRGIYDVTVYGADINFSGDFTISPEKIGISEDRFLWDQALLTVSIQDMTGVQKITDLKWGDKTHELEPNLSYINDSVEFQNIYQDYNRKISSSFSHDISRSSPSSSQSEISARIDERPKDNQTFDISLSINGSQDLSFAPLGKNTETKIQSNWEDPSFTGRYLPAERELNEDGFEATWNVLHFNREFPQQWQFSSDTGYWEKISDSFFGVNFYTPVDDYQQTTRSIKYGFMFIMLTFVIYFLVEVLKKHKAHFIQYLLVGFALCLFYLLLLSLSEHIDFDLAYMISSVAIIAMILSYTWFVFRSLQVVSALGVILSSLYVFLYSTLQSQNYSLLIGSVGLFVILGGVMFVSRNIDWNTVGK